MPSLGIKRTKYGPGDKQRAYLVDSLTAFYIIMCVLVSAAVLVFIAAESKEGLWQAQHELIDGKTEAEKFSHKAAVEILQMTAELEAHLAEEIEWDTQEQQYFERVQELEEELRIKVAKQVFALKEEIKTALKELPQVKADAVLTALTPVVQSLSDETDGAIGKFGDSIENLGQMFVEFGVACHTLRDVVCSD